MTLPAQTHYLISGSIPQEMVDTLVRTGHQEQVVQRLLLEGRLVSYALSADNGEWWAVCRAETDFELQLTLTEMPWHRPDQTRIAPLQQYTSANLGGFSLN